MGWIIAGAVFVVILVLLLCRVTVIFDYNGDIYLRIGYLFFTIVKIPARKKKTRRRNKKAGKAAKSALNAAENIETADTDKTPDEDKIDETKKTAKGASDKKSNGDPEKKKDKSEKTLNDIFELVKLISDSLGKPLKKLLKRTVISHFALVIVCGGDDAAKAALNFGRMNILVGNAMGWIDTFFTLKPVDDLRITVDFQSENTQTECHCEARLTLIAALAFVFTLLGRAIRYYRAHGKVKSAVDKFIKKK